MTQSDEDDREGSGAGGARAGAWRGQPRGREALVEIERRLGTLLGDVAGTLDRLRTAAADVSTSTAGSRAEDDAGEGGVGSGVSVRVGGIAAASAAGSGGGPSRSGRDEAAAARTPVIEVEEDTGRWIMTAELPGVRPGEIDLSVADGRLVLATTGRRRFAAAVEIPGWLRLDAIRTSLADGLLEASADRPAEDAGAGGREALR